MTTATTASPSASTSTPTGATPIGQVSSVDPALGDELQRAHDSLARAGAQAAANRILMAAEAFGELPAETLASMIDPGRVVSEIEEAKSDQARRWTTWRNVVALFPLLLTWGALGVAAFDYASYVAKTGDQTSSFLVLWINGFGGSGPNFQITAILDFIFLLAVVLLTILAQVAERRVAIESRELGAEIDAAAQKLTIAAEKVHIKVGKDPDAWVQAVQRVVNGAMAQTQKIADTNQASVDEFKKALDQLHRELLEYHKGVAAITTAAGQMAPATQTLGDAAKGLAGSAAAYTKTAVDIDTHLQQFVAIVESAAKDMTAAATAVDKVATQINAGMVDNLTVASRNLARVEGQLNKTTYELSNAARLLRLAAGFRWGLFGRLFGSSASASSGGNNP
jgi:methyl-accepting chemotaxis protein